MLRRGCFNRVKEVFGFMTELRPVEQAIFNGKTCRDCSLIIASKNVIETHYIGTYLTACVLQMQVGIAGRTGEEQTPET